GRSRRSRRPHRRLASPALRPGKSTSGLILVPALSLPLAFRARGIWPACLASKRAGGGRYETGLQPSRPYREASHTAGGMAMKVFLLLLVAAVICLAAFSHHNAAATPACLLVYEITGRGDIAGVGQVPLTLRAPAGGLPQTGDGSRSDSASWPAAVSLAGLLLALSGATVAIAAARRR